MGDLQRSSFFPDWIHNKQMAWKYHRRVCLARASISSDWHSLCSLSLCTLESVIHTDQYWINKSCYSFTNIPQGSLPCYFGENFQIKCYFSFFMCYFIFIFIFSVTFTAEDLLHVLMVSGHILKLLQLSERNKFIVVNNASEMVILLCLWLKKTPNSTWKPVHYSLPKFLFILFLV